MLALGTGSVAAEALPPLRINPSLLGAGTPIEKAVAEPAPATVVRSTPAAPFTAPALIETPAPAKIDLVPQQVTAQTIPQTAATIEKAARKAKTAPKKSLAAKPVEAPQPAAIAAAPATPAPQPLPAVPVIVPDAPRRTEEKAPAAYVAPQTENPPPATAQTLPPIDPDAGTPPTVEEQPVLAPLYSAHIAAGVLPEPQLLESRSLGAHPVLPGELLPTFITGDRIAGQTDTEMVITGNVELRKRNSILESDRMTHWQDSGDVEAEGNVRLSRDGDRMRGPKLRMNTDTSTGFFEQPEYVIRRIKTASAASLYTGTEEPANPNLTTGRGSAAKLEFEGEGKYRLTDATYSTCAPPAGSEPDWFAKTTDLRLDYDEEVGTARNATLYFKGMPMLYSPWMSFSLNNERKSGLLAPTFGSTSKGGAEYSQPVYWNIAPNMDATLTPRIMSKRGTLWNGEYRYLQPGYSGIIQGQVLPNDKLVNKRRSAYSLSHGQSFGYGVSGTLDLNGASDGTFFSDLANGSSVIAQTNLLRQGTLGYNGGWWSVNALAQSYQTLQDPSLPAVAEPYRRLPQITVGANRRDLPLGLNFAFSGEYVNFKNKTQTLEEARRVTMYPQFSLPITTEAFQFTPKIGLHSTRYARDRRPVGTPDRLTRDVPIFSLDSGVTFERPATLFDAEFIQTLEPRLYYLYVPVRDQSQYPVFDTGSTGFGFAQIFSENSYSGGDRIADANQVTAAITSRLLDGETGAQLLSGTVGQRIYFTTQNVGLPGEVLRTGRRTDFLGALSGQILPKTYVDAGVQYSPRFSRVEVLNIGGRYQPEAGKVLNAGYRYTRDQLGQIDISGQWPVFGGWHAVGRFNYSTKEARMIETVAGLEYDGGCWIGRAVFQRLATQTQQSNTALFFQLEFNGFAKIGSNPLDMLKRSVPGYGVINQQTDPTQPVTGSLITP